MKGCLVMKVMSKFTCNLKVMVLVFAGVLTLSANPRISSADISVESYCQLAVQGLQQDITNFHELVALVKQYQDDREILNQLEEAKKVEFKQFKEALFLSFGITGEEYGMYMGRNRRKVNAYLNANPEMKRQIDDLSAQVGLLIEEYESLKGTGTPGPPLPSQ
jgi:hypothetical protein